MLLCFYGYKSKTFIIRVPAGLKKITFGCTIKAASVGVRYCLKHNICLIVVF